MATPFDSITRLFDTMNESGVTLEQPRLDNTLEAGIIKASIELGKELTIDYTNRLIVEDLSNAERLLTALCTYRALALSEHKKYATKATNFKTINFAVSGLTERAKEFMRIIWWCDAEIEKITGKIASPVNGKADEMKESENA